MSRYEDGKGAWNPALTRRALVTRMLQASGVAVLAGGSGLLAACGGGGSNGTSSSAATSTSAESGAVATTAEGQPTRGGTIRFAAVSGLRGFDPQKWWDGFIWSGVTAISDPILVATQQGELAPGLATLPKVTNDGTLYTFTLQPGVKFHHGRVMTADDAKFSLDRLLSPAFASEGASLYAGLPIVGLADVQSEKAKSVSGIKVVDDQTFTIELEKPESALSYVLTLPFATILPRDVVEEMGDKKFNMAPVGTGPFVMKDVDVEKSLVLERFPDYWNSEFPYVDRVEWSMGTDVDLAVLQVQNGDLDMIMDAIPNGTIDQLRNDPGKEGQLIVGPENLEYFMNLNVADGPLTDGNVRRAIAMALDRDRLVRTLKGLPIASTGGLFTKLSPYYQEGLAIPYDPEGAKKLLADAGFTNGAEITILGQTQSPFTEMAQTAQADLKAVGINAKAETATVDVWIEKAYSSKTKPPMVAHLWDLPYPHGSYFMDGAFTSSAIKAGCCNVSLYQNADFDKLAKDAHLAQDPAEIVDLYKQMDKKVVQDDVAAVPLFQAVRIEFLSKRMQGFFVPATLSTAEFFRNLWIDDSKA